MLFVAMIMLHILSVDSQTCYDASTYCINSWRWSPISCNPSLSITVPDIYSAYCYPNDVILWKNGINDGSSSPTDRMIDYNFIICNEELFSFCGYVPLKSADSSSSSSSECGQVFENSGIVLGTGLDLSLQTNESLWSLGASIQTLEILNDYYGLKGSVAAERICNKPFNIDQAEAYNLTINFINEYMTQVSEWYEEQRGDDSLSFIELPLGIRTVMTSIHWKWGHFSSYPMFWRYVLLNDFENAIKELRSWYDNGATDKRLSAEANIMEASLGCITNNNMMGPDVVFLLDESGSVGVDHFDVAKNWVVEFIQYFDELNLNSRSVRFGVATFSDDYTDWVYLNEYSTFDEYKTNILSIPYDAGGTYLGDALKKVGVNQFVTSNGMRQSSKGAGRLLIVLTDGDSSDAVDEGIISLQNLNLNVIAIGIGSYNIAQLKQITIPDNIYGIDTYPDLDTILSVVMIKTCYIPTQLNMNNNATIIQDIVIQKYGYHYFELFVTDNNDNVLLNITQTTGCIYVYISYSIQYPSYFMNDINFTSCTQSFKQIILSPQHINTSNNIYIAIEGRNIDTSFNMDIGACNKTICQIGTNYIPKLNTDPPYSIDNKIISPTMTPSTYYMDDKINIFAQSYQQPSVTETPIFVVSILLGIIILLWASLYFLCNGLDVCKNSGVGEMMDVKLGIFYKGRNKFMSFVSLVLIIWELTDFILDLVTTIGIFVKGQEANINTKLYNRCGAASVFAFIASILLFFGKVQLWKTFYPQINQDRKTKTENEKEMENIGIDNAEYTDKWNEYYKTQKKIGEYLGHLIMYDLFGVALEDCIQITVTWYIKNDLLFSNQDGFMTAWLWLTFIASLLSVSFKLFRALLLKLGCHHDSYRADLKPKGYELVTDLQPLYIDNTARLRNLHLIRKNSVKSQRQKPEYERVLIDDEEVADTKNENEDDSFSKQLKKQYESLYDDIKENKWTPNMDDIYKNIEICVQQWAVQKLEEDESTKNKIKQTAINNVAKQENMRIIDEMKQNGIDVVKYHNNQNKNVSDQELYKILSTIKKTAFDDDDDDDDDNDNEMKCDYKNIEIMCCDEIKKEYEIFMLQWALQELQENESMKQEIFEKAMDEFISCENKCIFDELKRKGFDATKYLQNETPQQAYYTLCAIRENVKEIKESNQDTTTNLSTNVDLVQ